MFRRLDSDRRTDGHVAVAKTARYAVLRAVKIECQPLTLFETFVKWQPGSFRVIYLRRVAVNVNINISLITYGTGIGSV